MDDEFLKQYRQAPRPEFARQLQTRIEGGTMQTARPKTWRQQFARWSPALIAAALVVAAIMVVSLPPARALAQDFLNLFRVKKFATVQIDPARMQELQDLSIDPEKLFAENVEVLQEPGEPVEVGSVQEASERAGFTVAVPSLVPENAQLTVSVQGAGEAILTADNTKAQEILELTGVSDVQVPAQLDGAKITVRKPAAVILQYKIRNRGFTLMQSPSPEIELPPGVELKQLGEIALRVLGLSPDDARNFANSVDWSSTFLVPIRADAAEVRQVDVNGAEGLMLTSTATAPGDRNPRRAGDAIILWAKDGMVYALEGDTNLVDLLQTANSVQ